MKKNKNKTINQEHKIILKMYATNKGTPNFIRDTIRSKISRVIVDHLNSQVSQIERSPRQKVSRETVELNDTKITYR